MASTTSTLVLLITLWHQGHWIGGQTGRVDVQWPLLERQPAATLRWQLRYAQTVLEHGVLQLSPGDAVVTLEVQTPRVRAQTLLQWTWTLHTVEDAQAPPAASGVRDILLHPGDAFAGLKERMGERRLVVIDQSEGIPAVLSAAGVPFTAADSERAAVVRRADLIVVGPDRLGSEAGAGNLLMQLASSGVGVAVFAQTQAATVLGVPLQPRPAGAQMLWRAEHPLLSRLTAAQRTSWLPDADAVAAGSVTWRALALPADEPVLEIAYWPFSASVADDVDPATARLAAPPLIDALIAERRVDQGRVILWQLPLGHWGDDVRSQLALAGVIDRLLMRSEPTPPPRLRIDQWLAARRASAKASSSNGSTRPDMDSTAPPPIGDSP
jgi:hypothetical protein